MPAYFHIRHKHGRHQQLAEISIHKDIVVLATPEIGGLPFVISGMVVLGASHALSTSDGLLLAMLMGSRMTFTIR